jgi:hypothetical protein
MRMVTGRVGWLRALGLLAAVALVAEGCGGGQGTSHGTGGATGGGGATSTGGAAGQCAGGSAGKGAGGSTGTGGQVTDAGNDAISSALVSFCQSMRGAMVSRLGACDGIASVIAKQLLNVDPCTAWEMMRPAVGDVPTVGDEVGGHAMSMPTNNWFATWPYPFPRRRAS